MDKLKFISKNVQNRMESLFICIISKVPKKILFNRKYNVSQYKCHKTTKYES